MFPALTYFLVGKYVKTTKNGIKFMEFSFYVFPSSDMNLQAYFIFFSPTRQEYPCRDPSTVEYNACALTLLELDHLFSMQIILE